MAFRPVASAYRWIYADAQSLASWRIASDQYKQMSATTAVTRAAETGAGLLRTATQDLIYGTPSLNGTTGRDFSGVAERVTVWSDTDNTYFGVPEGDPALAEAWEMDAVMPVIDVVMATEGDHAIEAFEQALESGAF